MYPFKKIFNKVAKTSDKMYYYPVEKVDVAILDKFISSSVTEGDIFGIEFHIKKDDVNSYLYTTPSMRLKEQEQVPQINPDLRFNLIRLKYSNFFPIYTERKKLLPEYLTQLSRSLLNEEEIILQYKFSKRQGNWRVVSASQLEDYVYGIDIPTSNSVVRKAQSYIYEKDSRRSISDEKFNALERKIREENFRSEIILGTYADSDDREEMLIDSVKDIFEKYDYMNQFESFEMDSIVDLHTTTFHQYEKQYLSISEMYCLVSQERLDGGLPEIPKQPIQPLYVPEKERIDEGVRNNEPLKELKPVETFKAIELLPTVQKKKVEMDTTIPHKINNSLKRAKAIKSDLNYDEMLKGATTTKVVFEMPEDVVLTNITKKANDIKAALGTEHLTITQGDKPNTVAFYIPNKERTVVYLKELLQNPKFLQFAKNNALPFSIGEDEVGNPLFQCLTKAPHILSAGATGSGKSVWLNQLILTLILIKNPSELMIYIIDPKKVEFGHLKGFPHVIDVFTNMKKSFEFLYSLVDEMEKRYETLEKSGHRNIANHNANVSDSEKIPYLVCLVDEFNDLRMQFPQIEECLERLGQKARAAGIHLIIATQRPDADVISGVIKTNLPSVVCFRLKNNNEYKTVFGKGQPYHLLGRGHGVMSMEGQIKEYVQFQGACITTDENEEMAIIQKMKDYFNGKITDSDIPSQIEAQPQKPIEIQEIEEPVEEDPIDKLKRIIANTGETRVSQLQKEMGIRMNTVQDLMQQLVDEGWLFKHAAKSKGYELVADNDVLNKWRDTPIEKEGINEVVDKPVEKDKPKEYTVSELNTLIDEALQNKDKELFLKYTDMLNKLRGGGE